MSAGQPVSAIADGLGPDITPVQSYRNNLDFGLLACCALVPDLWVLTGHITDAVGELSSAAATAWE